MPPRHAAIAPARPAHAALPTPPGPTPCASPAGDSSRDGRTGVRLAARKTFSGLNSFGRGRGSVPVPTFCSVPQMPDQTSRGSEATPAPDARGDVPADAQIDAQVDLREVVQRHQAGIWRYLRALGASPQLAEELLQDTFVVAWRRGLEDRGDVAVATFLRRTARHLYLKNRRAQGRRDEMLADAVDRLWQRAGDVGAHDGSDDGSDDGTRADENWLAALRHCTQQLEARSRTALHLCYGPDAVRGGRDQAAETLGMKPNGLKTLLQRVRSVLRDCIENKLEGER